MTEQDMKIEIQELTVVEPRRIEFKGTLKTVLIALKPATKNPKLHHYGEYNPFLDLMVVPTLDLFATIPFNPSKPESE